jgi:DNA polymerase I-like protein with 3'-5' exonuclease and polymerase domains
MEQKQAVAIDFETYYDKDCSVRGATPRNYCLHEKFEAYLVAIYAPDEFEYVGHPKDFDWTQLEGRTIIAHNASFEEAVILHLMVERIIAEFKYRIHCTADMCVYLQLPRTLKGAVYALFDTEIGKEVRDNLKGKTWHDIQNDGTLEEVLEYALDDAVWCWHLWENLSKDWNEKERRLSALTRKMGYTGVTINADALADGIDTLQKVVFDTETDIPWTQEYDSKNKQNFPPTSVRGLAVTCQKHGIDPPQRTAVESDERKEWEERYGDKFPWIAHMSNFRKANKHLKTLQTIQNRLIDGMMPYGLKYYGAEVTGRWSGDSGFNTQNMPRDANFGVNVRNLLIPRKGHKFIICDLSQIEPRCLAYLSGDAEFLSGVREGMSPYEVHARTSMGWTGGSLKKEDPDLYLLAKVRVLSLGYGASFQSFVRSASAYGASHVLHTEVYKADQDAFKKILHRRSLSDPSKSLTDWYEGLSDIEKVEAVNAWLQVQDFRESNSKIVNLWKRYDKLFKQASSEEKHGSRLDIALPCGRPLRYFNITPSGYSFKCFTQKKDSPQYNRFRYMYGSRIVENLCQAMARSVFGECLLEIEAQGFNTVLQIHDEAVVEVPAETAEQDAVTIESIMSQSPKWAETLPVSAESSVVDFYKK